MSAQEMEHCECQLGHTGPLVVLVDARCSAGCRGFSRTVNCDCCGVLHALPFAAPFTAEEDARLLALRAEGRTWEAIGREMGRALASVHRRHRWLCQPTPMEESA